MSYRSSSEHRHHRSHSFDRDSGDNWNARRDDISISTRSIQLDKPSERFYDSEPRKTLFVGRLSPVTTEDELRKFFERFGEIRSLTLIRDILTGDSRRYAFLEYSRSKEADRAYAEGNNATIDGRRILVDREHGREEKTSIKTLRRPGGTFQGNNNGGPMRHSFGSRNLDDFSLSKAGGGFQNRSRFSFNGSRGGGGRGGQSFNNNSGGHYHPYSGGRSSNGNSSHHHSNGGGSYRAARSGSSSFSRERGLKHESFDESLRSRMHGSNSGGYGPSYRRR